MTWPRAAPTGPPVATRSPATTPPPPPLRAAEVDVATSIRAATWPPPTRGPLPPPLRATAEPRAKPPAPAGAARPLRPSEKPMERNRAMPPMPKAAPTPKPRARRAVRAVATDEPQARARRRSARTEAAGSTSRVPRLTAADDVRPPARRRCGRRGPRRRAGCSAGPAPRVRRGRHRGVRGDAQVALAQAEAAPVEAEAESGRGSAKTEGPCAQASRGARESRWRSRRATLTSKCPRRRRSRRDAPASAPPKREARPRPAPKRQRKPAAEPTVEEAVGARDEVAEDGEDDGRRQRYPRALGAAAAGGRCAFARDGQADADLTLSLDNVPTKSSEPTVSNTASSRARRSSSSVCPTMSARPSRCSHFLLAGDGDPVFEGWPGQGRRRSRSSSTCAGPTPACSSSSRSAATSVVRGIAELDVHPYHVDQELRERTEPHGT